MESYRLNEEYVLLKNKNNKYLLLNISSQNYYIFSNVKELIKIKNLNIILLKKIDDIINNNIKEKNINYNLPLNLKFFEDYNIKPHLDYTPNNQKLNLMQDKKKLEEYYNIKVDKNNIRNKYYYDKDSQCYDLLTPFILGCLIEKDFEFILDDGFCLDACLGDNELNTLFQMFRVVEETDNDAICFKNCVINTSNWKEVSLNTFTTKKIKYNYIPLEECKENTFLERVLREILIPKNSSDESVFIDFLQRVGASFLRQNKHKFIYMLTGSGDDGKSILLSILRLLHGDLALTLKVKNLSDNFYTANLSNTNVLLLDELSVNSFSKEVTATIKDISGRGVIDSRVMYSQDTVKLGDYGIFFMATNVVPYVPFSDTAYWSRLHLVRLPNKFVNKKEEDLGENEYVLDDEVEEKLVNDEEGMEWLLSRSIKEYQECKGNFRISQSATDTQFIYDGRNPIRVFIENFIVETHNEEDIITALEIKCYLLQFCIKKGVGKNELGVSSSRELSQEIGYKLSNLFDLDKRRVNGVTAYKGLSINIDKSFTFEDCKEKLKNLENYFFE